MRDESAAIIGYIGVSGFANFDLLNHIPDELQFTSAAVAPPADPRSAIPTVMYGSDSLRKYRRVRRLHAASLEPGPDDRRDRSVHQARFPSPYQSGTGGSHPILGVTSLREGVAKPDWPLHRRVGSNVSVCASPQTRRREAVPGPGRSACFQASPDSRQAPRRWTLALSAAA
jgi:hypothetical protein